MGIEAATLALIAGGVGTAVNVYSAIQQGERAEDVANANAAEVARQGVREQDAAVQQAEKIRRAARAQVGAANAAMAASGVAIGEGTAVRINEQIYKDSEEDAYSTLLTGTRRQASADAQASIIGQQGSAARSAGYLNAGSSLLAGGAKIASGWKTPNRAPIIERSSFATD